MRVNLRSTTLARVAINKVLARPGTPTIRLLPPTNNVSSACAITSSCPTMSFLSSETISRRPAFILSASAMSSAESRFTVLVTDDSTAVSFQSQRQRPVQSHTYEQGQKGKKGSRLQKGPDFNL